MTAATTDDGPRAAVVAAGQRLVAQQGLGFTIHELVREAGVALQTFYRYFGGKDHLLVALIGRQIAEHCERLRVAASSEKDPVVRLRLHLHTTLAPLPDAELARARFIAGEHWRLHQHLPEQLAEATQPFADLMREELDAGQSIGALHPRHPSLDAWLITRTVMSAVHHFAYCPADWTEAAAGAVAEFCLAAVGGVVDGDAHEGLARTPSRRATARRALRGPARRSGAGPAA